MKNALKTGLAILMWASMPFAGAVEKPKAEIIDTSKIEIINFDVELTNNGEVVGKYSTSVPMGATNSYQNIVKTTYVESMVKHKGVTKFNPGTATSGFEMDLTPRLTLKNGNVLVQFAASFAKLNGISRFTQEDNTYVESPDLSTFKAIQVVSIKKGDLFELSSLEIPGKDLSTPKENQSVKVGSFEISSSEIAVKKASYVLKIKAY